MDSYSRDQTCQGGAEPTERLAGKSSREYLHEALQCALDELDSRGKAFATLFINLDGFGTVNESLGHDLGDQLLLELGHRLSSAVRPHDIVAHFGADEFTLIAKDVEELTVVESILHRVQHCVSHPFQLNEQQVSLSASIGVVLSSSHQTTPREIIRDASTAVNRAKSLGRARHVIFDASMHRQALQHLGLAVDLRRALDQDEFELYYQPLVSLETTRVLGFEALIRWNRPGHGMVAPDKFIPIAERNGLIEPIGRWVLQQGCMQLRQWTSQYPGQEISLSINVASLQISQTDLVGELIDLLEQYHLDPHNLKLEITESGIIDNPVAAAEVMHELHQLGAGLSIDDFGAGYSSLSQLYRLPFDTLKIDRLFIGQLCDEDDHSALFVEAILLLANNLGMSVVAEGIETDEQMLKLREMGCDIGQGYLFSKPLSCEQATDLLKNTCSLAPTA